MARDLFQEAGIQFDKNDGEGRDLFAEAGIEVEPKKKRRERSAADIAGDIGVTALKGAIGLPEAFVGLADIPTGGRVGKALEDAGVRFSDAKEMLDGMYSEAQQEANREVRQADGFVDTLKAAVANPSTIAIAAGESLPQMLGGAALARGGLMLAPKMGAMAAGAIGEGLMGAGAAASEIRNQNEDGLLTAKQAGIAALSGAGTAALGAVGGKVASKLGVGDIDTMLAQGAGKLANTPAGFAKAVVGAGISEGVFEELPQSTQEQMMQNWALDKPLLEGVGNAAAMGLLTGAAMGAAGGGYNALSTPRAGQQSQDPNAIDNQNQGQPQANGEVPTNQAAPETQAPAAGVAPVADPAARLAQLELEAESRALTPEELTEAQGLLAQLNQADEQDATQDPQGADPAAAPQAQPEQAPAAPGGDAAPTAGVPDQGGSPDIQAAGVDGPAPGMVRLYHGGIAPDGGPRWVTPDLAYAQGYASKTEGAGVFFVDVPQDSPQLRKAFDDSGTSIKAPVANFEAPAEIASQLRPLAPQASAAPILPPLEKGPDQNLQNRDRGRAASVIQMTDIAHNPDYMRLGPSRTPDSGAPMVFAVDDELSAIEPQAFGREDVAVMSDGQRVPFRYAVVDSTKVNPSNFADGSRNEAFDSAVPGTIKALNNGRTAGIRASHELGTSQGYVQAMQGDAQMHGIDPQVIARTPNPMLVRVYSDRDNTVGMAAKSQGQGLGMSPAELARQDAPLLDSSVLAAYQPGEISSAGNRDFVRAFMGKLQGAGQDVASLVTGDGQLSQDGRRRIQAALMQAAYGDSDLVEEMFDSTDTDIKAIGEALKEVAGMWANMRDSARLGAINPEVDITDNVIQAIGLIRKARRDRMALADLVNQPDLMTGQTPDLMTVGALRMFYDGQYFTRAVGRERLVSTITDYLRGAMATQADAGMFGDVVGATDILNAIIKTEGETNGETQPQDGRAEPAGRSPAGGDPGQAGAADGQQRAEARRARPAQGRKEGGRGEGATEGRRAGRSNREADRADGDSSRASNRKLTKQAAKKAAPSAQPAADMAAEWTRMTTPEREGLVLRAGLTEKASKNLAKRAWKDMDRVMHQRLAKGFEKPATQAEEGATPYGDQTQTKAFRDWFGNSKVVDEQGKPLVLYHATTGDFTEFKAGGNDPKISGPAIWMTDNKDRQPAMHNTAARGGAFRDGANVMPLYARIERPLVIDDKATLDWARKVFANGSNEFPQIILPEWANEVTRDGEYDGIIFDGPAIGWKDAVREYIAFKPEQIKSAIGNAGTFDPNDARITREISPMYGEAGQMVADYLSQFPARPPAGMDRAQYRAFIDGRQQGMRDLVQRLMPQAEGLLLPVRNGGFWGVTREARPDGSEWRVTRFDSNMEPQGHEAHNSVESALEDVIQWADPARITATMTHEQFDMFGAHTEGQLDLFGQAPIDKSQASPEGEAAKAEGIDAAKAVLDTKTLMGLALSRDWAARQRATLVGQKVNDAHDLALLAQVYRDPRFETFRLVFTDKDGKVVSQMGLTSRLPGSTPAIAGEDVFGFMDDMLRTARDMGATSYYLLHNHPSGQATPSTADERVTRTYTGLTDGKGLTFKGHVVIDTNEYAVIDRNGDWKKHSKDFGQPAPLTYGEWGGYAISGPADVMALAKRLEVDHGAITLVTMDWQHKVRGITSIPASAVSADEKATRWVVQRAIMKQQGAKVVAVGRDRAALKRVSRVTLDAIHIEDNGAVTSLVGTGQAGSNGVFPTDRVARLSPETGAEWAYMRQRLEWERENLAAQRRAIGRESAQEAGADYGQRNELVTVHNLSADNLIHADELGGLPAPSLAISKVSAPLDGFGDITLIGGTDLAKPSAKNPVFDADVYSPRFPRSKAKVNAKMVRQVVEPLMEAAKKAGKLARGPESAIDRMEQNRLSDAIRDLSYDMGLRIGYANTVLGKNLAVPMKPVDPKPVAIARAPLIAQSPLRELLPTLDVGKLTPDTAGDLGQSMYAALVNKTLADIEADGDTPPAKQFDKAMEMVNRRIRLFAESSIEQGSIEFAPEKIGKMTPEGLTRLYNTVRNSRSQASTEAPPPAPSTEIDIKALDELLDREAPREQFDEWLAEKLRPAMGERRIYRENGTTAPYTLENIVKAMTRKVRDAEGFNYGLGNARSKGAHKFKNLKAMQAQRERVVDRDTFEAARKEIDAEFTRLAQEVTPFQKYPRESAFELLAEAIGNSFTVPLSKALNDAALIDVPADLQQEIADFAGALVGAPTEYFEAKPQRAVGLGEFRGAVIPSTASPQVREILAKHGLEVMEYQRGERGARADAVQRLADRLNDASGDVLFSRTARTFSPVVREQAVASVQAQVERITARLANPPKVVVAFDMDDARIPEEIRAEDRKQRSGGARGTPEGFYYRGTAYIMASQMKAPKDTARAFAHEVLGHFGLRGLFGQELRPILRQIVAARPEQVAAKVKEYGLRGVSDLDNLTAAEEVLAEMAQTNPQLGFVKRTVAAIRTWLRKNVPGFKGLALTDDEIIRSYILPARDFVTRGRAAANVKPAQALLAASFARPDEPAAPFYSGLFRAVGALKTERAPAQGWIEQIRGLVANGKAKADEVEWSGITDWLKLQTGRVSRDQILAALDGSGVKVDEVVLGNPGLSGAEAQELAELRDLYRRREAGEQGAMEDDEVDRMRALERKARGEPRAITSDEALDRLRNNLPVGWRRGDQVVQMHSPDSIVEEGSYYREVVDNGEAEWIDTGTNVSGEVTNTRYGRYTLPGGENYREVLLTLPGKVDDETKRLMDQERYLVLTPDEQAKVDAGKKKAGIAYRSSHWDQPNIVAHIRMNDRTDADGKRVLFIEELQSDWAQDGRKKGFKGDKQYIPGMEGDDNGFIGLSASGVPRAPFVESTDGWLNLALKRVITMAVDGGYDRVAFVTGEQSAERYDLSKQVDSIHITKLKKGGFEFTARQGGREIISRQTVPDVDALAGAVGKDLAEKANGQELDSGKTYTGLDLKVGGEGMRAFYDKIVPTATAKLIKKLGGEKLAPVPVMLPGNMNDQSAYTIEQDFDAPFDGEVTLTRRMPDGSTQTIGVMTRAEAYDYIDNPANATGQVVQQPGFDITPAMREAAAGGLPMFQRAYHGTPHRGIEQFSTDKVGTGEGAQAYGWGLYFASRREVAEYYRTNLSRALPPQIKLEDGRLVKRGDLDKNTIEGMAWGRVFNDLGGSGGMNFGGINIGIARDVNALQRSIKRVIERARDLRGANVPSYVQRETAIASYLENNWSGRMKLEEHEGQLYEVEIPEDSEMLLWDKPLSEQPDGFKAAVRKAAESMADSELRDKVRPEVQAQMEPTEIDGEDYLAMFSDENQAASQKMEAEVSKRVASHPDRQALVAKYERSLTAPDQNGMATGRSFYERLAKQMGGQEAASKYLNGLGLKGIKYLDGASRSDGEGSYNFVIFDGADVQIQGAMFSRSTLGGTPPKQPQNPNAWQRLKARVMALTSPQVLDTLIYEYQDKLVDLKRLREHIKAIGGTITDLNDAYLGEELFHKRVAKRTQDFLANEIRPLLADMRKRGVDMPTLERYLHARHAPEANAILAERNPNQAMIDLAKAQGDAQVKSLELQLQRAKARGTATKVIEQALAQARAERAKWNGAQAFKGTEDERTSLSGMSNAEAVAFMTGLQPSKRADLDALASRVDAINRKTVDTLERYGLMEKSALDAWRNTYQFYVPLHRDEAHPDSVSHPIGQGFSTKGDASKRRTGSNAKVTNILGHIAMQRETALTRGEKNVVAKKLYLMAAQNPDPDLWTVDKVPTTKTIDPNTGLVRTGVDPTYKNKPNVVMVRIGGKDRAIVFNERNETAVRLAQSIKGQDLGDLDAFANIMAKATRWFASVNTQYNPIFGLVNFARDVQGATLQLSSTPLAGKERQVLANVPGALRGIYRDLRGKASKNNWAALWDDLQNTGGTTGYRDLFMKPDERVQALESELKSLDRGQPQKAIMGMLNWLSDFNEAIENGVRLAVYKQALDQGISKERAASIAKNITVNFNRRGRQGAKLGAYYAFLNASIQGTTRLVETLRGPAGKKIMLGGVMLGALNTLLGMAVMGGGDDGEDDEWEKIPDFVKSRNVIIPLGRKDYLTIPMPLGFNVLPNIGRKAVEMMAHDDPTESRGKHIGDLALLILDSFNPLGGSENLMQMLTPTPMDPVVALMQNRDWTGRPIYREDMNRLDPTPGHTRAKDSASTGAKVVAKWVNAMTGGNDYQPGLISWTPDQIDYVVGQLTGGVGRELLKVEQTITAPITGDELPAHKIPVVGRLYGNTEGPANNSEKFYENVRQANMVENEIQGRARAGEDVDGFMASEPMAGLVGAGNGAEKAISDLRKQRRQIIAEGLPGYRDEVKAINEQIGGVMADFNRQVREAKKAANR